MLTRSETLFGISGCQVRQWGSFALTACDDGRDVTPRCRKARAIVAYLVSHAGTKISRERLAELLWGDREESHARASLRQALLEIRTACGSPFVEADREHLWIPVDRVRPVTAEVAGEAPLFDDLNHVSPEFDAWLTLERNRRTAELLEQQRREVESLLREGRGGKAIPLIDRMTALDPYDETTLCLAMQAEFQANRPSALQQRYQDTEQRNRREFGVGLPAETRALHDRLLAELCGETAKARPSAPAEKPEPAPTPTPAPRKTSGLGSAFGSAMLMAAVLGGYYVIGPAAAKADPQTVAVLPFRALGGVDGYLVDGFSEELLSDLARHPDLRVTGRTSAWMYKDRADDLRRIGRDLRVGYIVEGSVREKSGRLFVTAALVDARDGRTVWTRRFDGAQGLDVPIQASIGEGILDALQVDEQPGEVRVASREAYQLYLRAKGLFRLREKTSMVAAGELLRQALRMDPGFAPAWALLGGTIQLGPMGEDRRAEALSATGRALRLDPRSAEAHAMRALVLGFDSEAGRAHIARAVALNPNDSQTVYWSGSAAADAARFDLAAATNARATVMDPLWHRPVSVAIRQAMERGDPAAARRHLATIKAGNPDGALAAEIAMAEAEGDLSRVVALADRSDTKVPTSLRYEICNAWISIGLPQRCGEIGVVMPEVEKQLLQRRPTSQNQIVEQVRFTQDVGLIDLAAWELLRSGQHSRLVALSRIPDTRLHELSQVRPGNRLARITYAGRLAYSLERLGRHDEARAYWKAADEAGHYALRSTNVPHAELLAIAGNEAAQGRRSRALALLSRTSPQHWTWLNRVHGDIGEDPMFASLRGDPKFEAMRLRHLAWRVRERREAEALVRA